ncbi:response regulator transcription factor [Pseudomonas sp. HN2-3]|uniref:response regulator transcription factor n=1 Tax=Pseudomonas sp. HN2-3 TaxID=2886360 RepID=UPI001D11E7B0|nr:response regulator [Pseudomonas sp. HN2-3]UDU81199.1 response regulator [Pseudomonas sp. HN2-3]
MNRHSECGAFSPNTSDLIVVCIVDDDSSVRRSLSNLLRSAGFDTLSFASGEDFLASPQALGAGCALLDLKMQGLSGADVQRELIRLDNPLPVICMSAHWDDSALSESIRQGAVACLSKPFTEEALLDAVDEATKGTKH